MSKFTAFVILVVLRIMYHPDDAKKEMAPFAEVSPLAETSYSNNPLNTTEPSGLRNTFNLNGSIVRNESAVPFEKIINPTTKP